MNTNSPTADLMGKATGGNPADVIDLMIDLETLDTKPSAIVLSIGACFFDLKKGEIGATFHTYLTIKDQDKKGRTFSEETLRWWMGQSDAAKRIFSEKRKPTADGVADFINWCEANKNGKEINPWGNGATFDIAIIESLFNDFAPFENHEVDGPWKAKTTMDLRTFRRFVANNAPVPKVVGVEHNAKDDAINEANYVIAQHAKFQERLRMVAAQGVAGSPVMGR